MRHLLGHAEQRGTSDPDEQLLRYRNGQPITNRRHDHLWIRLAKHLPWVAVQQISTHRLRYTTLTWVERHFGYAVALRLRRPQQPTRRRNNRHLRTSRPL